MKGLNLSLAIFWTAILCLYLFGNYQPNRILIITSFIVVIISNLGDFLND